MNTRIPSFRPHPFRKLRSHVLGRVGPVLAVCALLTVSGDARGAGEPCTDLLGIGDFDDGTNGWVYSQVGGGIDIYFVAAPNDRLGNPASKAALVFDQSTLASADYPVDPLLRKEGDCLAVTPGQSVRVGGWIRIPTGQPRTGTAQFVMAWFSSPSCGSILDFVDTPVVSTPGDWIAVDDTFEVPPGAGGVSVAMRSLKNEADGLFNSYYDDLYLCVPEPGGTPLGAAAVLAVAALAGRRRQRSVARCPTHPSFRASASGYRARRRWRPTRTTC
ncbi:hypothetical protein KJ059_08410 [Myxococcota bacterium]|nr:hypothetical protein [Myxococcota bacterium]